MGEFTDGYSNNKYSNWIYNADGSIDQDASSPLASNAFSSADVPVIRLAEIYLSAAEAYVLSNGAAGNADDALTYFNYVRERAGVTPVTAGALTETNILDERARELYGENCAVPIWCVTTSLPAKAPVPGAGRAAVSKAV